MSETTYFDKETARCDDEVYRKGEVITVLGDHPGSERIEAWVVRIRKASGQRVDWHFFAGRAVIKALGNTDAVVAVMEKDPAP